MKLLLVSAPSMRQRQRCTRRSHRPEPPSIAQQGDLVHLLCAQTFRIDLTTGNCRIMQSDSVANPVGGFRSSVPSSRLTSLIKFPSKGRYSQHHSYTWWAGCTCHYHSGNTSPIFVEIRRLASNSIAVYFPEGRSGLTAGCTFHTSF